jgi:hypothetical protein
MLRAAFLVAAGAGVVAALSPLAAAVLAVGAIALGVAGSLGRKGVAAF